MVFCGEEDVLFRRFWIFENVRENDDVVNLGISNLIALRARTIQNEEGKNDACGAFILKWSCVAGLLTVLYNRKRAPLLHEYSTKTHCIVCVRPICFLFVSRNFASILIMHSCSKQ